MHSVVCLNQQFDLKLFIFSDPHGIGWHMRTFAGNRFDCADYSWLIVVIAKLKLKLENSNSLGTLRTVKGLWLCSLLLRAVLQVFAVPRDVLTSHNPCSAFLFSMEAHLFAVPLQIWMAETCWANPERLYPKHCFLMSPEHFCSRVRAFLLAPRAVPECTLGPLSLSSWGEDQATRCCLQPQHTVQQGVEGYTSNSHSREGQGIKTAGSAEPSP